MDATDPRIEAEERRSAPRFPVNLRGTISLLSKGSTSTCTVTELSLHGCGVRTDGDYNGGADARVEVSFTLKGAAFRVGGVTQWAKGKNELGIRFVGLSERREAQLRELLHDVEADLAASEGREAAERREAAAALSIARAQMEHLEAELASAQADEESARQAVKCAAEQVCALTRRFEEQRKAHAAAQRLCAELEAKEAARQKALAAQESDPAPQRPEPARADESVAPNHNGRGAVQEFDQTARPFLVEQKKGSAPPSSPGGTEPASTTGIATPPAGKERRRETRHAVDAHAKILLLDVRSIVGGRILDVSVSGCRIRSAERFPVGIYRRVEVEFVLDGLPFRLPGVVQSLHDRFTVGIRFLDVSERKQEQIRMVIEELAEMQKENG